MLLKCDVGYLYSHGSSVMVLRAAYLFDCCRVLSDGQHNAPAPVIGALTYPNKPPRPQEVQTAIRPDDVRQQLPPLLCYLLQMADIPSKTADNLQ